MITKGKDLKSRFMPINRYLCTNLQKEPYLFSCRCIIRVFSIDNL